MARHVRATAVVYMARLRELHTCFGLYGATEKENEDGVFQFAQEGY